MQYNYRSQFLVVINENTCVSVYKYEKYKYDQPIISFQAKNIYIGKSTVCEMTESSGAAKNSSDYDGNTLLGKVEDRKYVYISGLEITEIKTNDKVIDCIHLMGNNMVPYAIILGENFTYFLYHRYKFIENDKIQEGTLLNTTNGSLDPFDYHLEKCGVDSFKKLERSLTHREDIENEVDISDVQDEIEEDGNLIETQYLNGNNELVKIFNQKCVICYERDSVYAFRQCDHQCICEQCYQKKGDIDISKCVVCRT